MAGLDLLKAGHDDDRLLCLPFAIIIAPGNLSRVLRPKVLGRCLGCCFGGQTRMAQDLTS
jgi:hypothetical protein